MSGLWLDVFRVGADVDLPDPELNANTPEIYYAEDVDALYLRKKNGWVKYETSTASAVVVSDFDSLPADPPVGAISYITDSDDGSPGHFIVSGNGSFEVLAVYNGNDWVVIGPVKDNSPI
jgi:hypothetical protein